MVDGPLTSGKYPAYGPPMMTLREQLLHLATVYAEATGAKSRSGGISLPSVSMKIFGDGKALPRLADGSDMTTGNFEKALRWFSANWPDDLPWPDDVARPEVTGEAA